MTRHGTPSGQVVAMDGKLDTEPRRYWRHVRQLMCPDHTRERSRPRRGIVDLCRPKGVASSKGCPSQCPHLYPECAPWLQLRVYNLFETHMADIVVPRPHAMPCSLQVAERSTASTSPTTVTRRSWNRRSRGLSRTRRGDRTWPGR